MNKNANREMISETIVYLFKNGIINAPEYSYLIHDQNLPDAFYASYINKNGNCSNKASLLKLGRTAINAGLKTTFMQQIFGKDVANFGDDEIDYMEAFYQEADIIAHGKKFFEQFGWGDYDTVSKKDIMYSEIANIAIKVYEGQNVKGMFKKIDYSNADNYAYCMFCIGVTLAMKGNLVRAKDF